jgi:peptide/nickel transport system substrate-binding protein
MKPLSHPAGPNPGQPHTHRRVGRHLGVAAVVAVLAATLTACGGSSHNSATGPGTTAPGSASSTTGGTPKTGGTLTFGTSADWAGIDPQLVASGVAQVVFNQIFEGLVTRDRTINTDSPPIKPGLAESWTTSPDRRTYTFKLRPNVTFQDGTPFNANAAQFNFRRWRDPSFQYYSAIAAGNTAALMQEVAATSVIAPMTFAVTLKAPDAGLIDRMSGSSFYYMVSPAAIQKYGNTGFGQHGIGTGPFMVKSFQQGQRLVLVRNNAYWGAKPYLDSIVFQPIPDAGARVAAVVSGEVDVAMEIPPDSLSTINSSGNATSFELGKPATFTIMPNMKEAPFNNALVRQAVSLAINRQAIVTDLMKGAASVGTQLYGKGNAGYDPTLSAQDPYDPTKARQLLAQAGYPNGFSTKMPCSPAGTGIPSTDLIMEQVQSDLAKIGVKVQLQMTEWNSYLTTWLKGIPQGQGIGAECMSIGTDDAYILNMYANDHNEPPVGWNINWYSNARVDTLLKEASLAATTTQYLALERQAQKILIQDRGDIFILHDTGPYAVSKRVHGWVPARSWLQDLSRAWLS